MPTYGIDVVFRSDTLLWSAQSPTTPNPIAMAFGYSYLPDTGPKAEKGEQCKRHFFGGLGQRFGAHYFRNILGQVTQVRIV